MSTERDTHFQGAAKCLAAEIADTDGWHLAAVETLIAHFAYDLARHIVRSTMGGTTNAITTIIAEYVPDMTEWPKRD